VKKLLLVSIFILLSSLSSFAKADMKLGIALDMDLSLVAQIDRYNLVLGDRGFAVDYLIKIGQFDNKTPLSWYFSGGGWAEWDDGFGVRVPVGISWYFAKDWDLYGQVQPVANFDDGFNFSVDGAIGVRFSF
jgi:hypothetical protein